MGCSSSVVTEYPSPGLGAHPIYWLCVDALAVAKVVAELRNWLHDGTCKLMYTRGAGWVQGPCVEWVQGR